MTRALKEYKTVAEIAGPLLVVEGVSKIQYGDRVEIELSSGE